MRNSFCIWAESPKSLHFAGMAGCYDIGLHYDYEVGRGVAYLSTMARAMGGSQGFDPQSPAVILNSIATAASIPKSSVPQMSAR